jgi:hypothetical protein
MVRILASCGALVAVSGAAHAQAFIDPVGDFRTNFPVGLRQPYLDVTGGAVYFNGTQFILTGTVAGPIPADAPENLAYVYGVNRGTGTARFDAAPSDLDLPGILFDAAIILRPNGPDALNFFTSLTPITPAIGSVSFSGNTFTAVIAASALPSPNGTPFEAYTFNLWPRLIGAGAGTPNPADVEIPDFAPNATNVGITAVPEPATVLLLAPALVGLYVARRRRAR